MHLLVNCNNNNIIQQLFYRKKKFVHWAVNRAEWRKGFMQPTPKIWLVLKQQPLGPGHDKHFMQTLWSL